MAQRLPDPPWYERPRVREFAFQVGVNVTSALLVVLILYLGGIATGIIRKPEVWVSLVAGVLGVLVGGITTYYIYRVSTHPPDGADSSGKSPYDGQ